MVKLKPLSDRIIVRREEPKSRTEGGIILPDSAKERPQRGEVLAVGDGRVNDKGELLPMSVAVGDVVLFARYGGNEVPNEPDLLIIHESEVLCVVE